MTVKALGMSALQTKIAVSNKTGGCCWYCGVAFTESIHMCIDHANPRLPGLDNSISNLLPSCRPCNSSKGTKTVEQFRRWREWQRLDVTPFDQTQIDYLLHYCGVELPDPPPFVFFGER